MNSSIKREAVSMVAKWSVLYVAAMTVYMWVITKFIDPQMILILTLIATLVIHLIVLVAGGFALGRRNIPNKYMVLSCIALAIVITVYDGAIGFFNNKLPVINICIATGSSIIIYAIIALIGGLIGKRYSKGVLES